MYPVASWNQMTVKQTDVEKVIHIKYTFILGLKTDCPWLTMLDYCITL